VGHSRFFAVSVIIKGLHYLSNTQKSMFSTQRNPAKRHYKNQSIADTSYHSPIRI
jgi:hypothetical protein